MNTDTIKGDWTETKAKIKARWGKFTDDGIESLKGNMEQLSGQLQKLYGYAKEQADREYTEFKASLHAATGPAKKPAGEETKTSSAPESKKVA